MLTSILLVAIAQQDSGDVHVKWADAQAVWSGYAGATGRTGDDHNYMEFTVLRDGRYLARSIFFANGQSKLVEVEHFDGKRTVTYDVEADEYIVAHEQHTPTWAEPYQLLWGSIQPEPNILDARAELVSFPASENSAGFTGFLTTFKLPNDAALVLRSKDMCPLYQIRILMVSGNAVEIERYPECRPILHERHCDREVDWSLPPGAKLVDKLKIDR